MAALIATVNIIGSTDWLIIIAALPEIRKHVMRIFRDPNLSVRNPLGMDIIAEHSGGTEAMSPSCWMVRSNSVRKMGKSAG